MYLEIDGKSYVIHLKSNIKHIMIRNVSEIEIHLNVPVDFPHESLITYIKTELINDITQFNEIEKVNLEESIHLFDKNYKIRHIYTGNPYLKDDILYTNVKELKSTIKRESLKSTLLQNKINSIISRLEDDLNVIIPAINLKKFKTKYYTICPKSNLITFNRTLVDKSHEFITYVVILSVGDFLKYSKEEIDNLTKVHITNWRHCERIWKYEQQ
ncbi:YgjP-like metallopeptidase domain-containing protein [Sphingobacterium bovistauri]|uniref:M48 family metallopeptidase n=1 Tax=Sphingobacterium bovistauri TaxID=2781959 RepID=A0ABS7Z9I5_9SPHI|nr:YgjP-like metallopeptidase domain-containing protein [Sphingobacterium bovistauri]MCA5006815.1 M48 family metallopeptidase [Sphingobacterium bovistauri]